MTHDPTRILEEQLRENLPDIIRRVVADYGLFAIQDSPLEAKDFDRHHKAARAGVAHLLALSRLAATVKADAASPAGELETLLRETRHLLAENHDEGDADAPEDQF